LEASKCNWPSLCQDVAFLLLLLLLLLQAVPLAQAWWKAAGHRLLSATIPQGCQRALNHTLLLLLLLLLQISHRQCSWLSRLNLPVLPLLLLLLQAVPLAQAWWKAAHHNTLLLLLHMLH
jgi:hypothetical protein